MFSVYLLFSSAWSVGGRYSKIGASEQEYGSEDERKARFVVSYSGRKAAGG